MGRQLTTRGLVLGLPEAEIENRTNDISEVFIDCTGIEDAVKAGKFIICGRKGSGKSAYAAFEKRRDSIADQHLSTIVRKDDFALEELVNNEAATSKTRNVLFEWIILTKLVDLILESGIINTHQDIRALRSFKEKNAGLCRIDRYNIEHILNENEVNFAPLKSQFGFLRKVFASKTVKAPFFKMIGPLREIVSNVLRMQAFEQIDFKVFFDDLDVNFKLSEASDREMIADLIRIVKRYNTEYLLGTHAAVILLLRDDIMDKLPGEDGAQSKTLASAAHKIKWYNKDPYGDGRSSLLRKMINRRIAAAMRRAGHTEWADCADPWTNFVVPTLGGKASFKYVLDFTFYLPRDLMGIFKDISSRNMKLPLSQTDIDALISDYSIEKKREICDELSAHFSYEQINNIVELLAQVDDTYNADYNDLKEGFERFGLDMASLQTLIDLNLIIPVDNDGNLYFSYRERIATGHISSYHFRVPYILTRYFEIR